MCTPDSSQVLSRAFSYRLRRLEFSQLSAFYQSRTKTKSKYFKIIKIIFLAR